MSSDRTSESASYPPIDDYALIGDCRSAGLVSCDGSLDWLCLPRFDSPSIFAAVLDAKNGGRFLVRPIGEFRTERRYLANTNVLETVFRTPTGECVLRDLMSVSSEVDKRTHLTPEHEVLRELEGLEGEVEVEILYYPRPDYGRVRPLLEERGALGLRCEAEGTSLTLRSEMPLKLTDSDRSALGTARIRSGERKYLSLTYSMEAPAVVPLLGEAARGRIEQTVRWWQEWANRCTYEGPYRDAVVRSALALKLMTYAPSGALVAAPTTSLPETIGGVRNWDYRYCWLRDASFTLRALYALGYREEAEAYIGWLLNATRLNWPELQGLYRIWKATRGLARCGSATTLRASSSLMSMGRSSTEPPGSWIAAGASTATRAGCSTVWVARCAGTGASRTRGSGRGAPAASIIPTRRYCAGSRSTASSRCTKPGIWRSRSNSSARSATRSGRRSRLMGTTSG